jgi:hypothetical protein
MNALPVQADDALNEYLIEFCYQRMKTALDVPEQKFWFARMGFYVDRRSPERMREMERAKGL